MKNKTAIILLSVLAVAVYTVAVISFCLGDVANHITFKRPRDAYRDLIDRISGKGTWQRNPWVYVYTFELLK